MLARTQSHDREEDTSNPNIFSCLGNNDVITAKISDHHPVIHDGVLFWNMMMQGRMRKIKDSISYNNGFGIIESDEQYMKRLIKAAHVIAETVLQNPSIETIGLCEGPIQPLHINILHKTLRKFTWMHRFLQQDTFYKPSVTGFPSWGLLMLTDSNNTVSKIKLERIEHTDIYSKLANRLQIWKLTNDSHDKYFVLAHFPFGGNEYASEKSQLSTAANTYSQLINDLLNYYADDHLILCADFNFNPYLINQWKDRAADKISNHNSILLTIEAETRNKTINTVTVDGILLSKVEKQKYYAARPNPGLFVRLAQEYSLFKPAFCDGLKLLGSEWRKHTQKKISDVIAIEAPLDDLTLNGLKM